MRGQRVAPFFCLARAAWIPYALTWDPETGAFHGVEARSGSTPTARRWRRADFLRDARTR
jgi:hypothetical protein